MPAKTRQIQVGIVHGGADEFIHHMAARRAEAMNAAPHVIHNAFNPQHLNQKKR